MDHFILKCKESCWLTVYRFIWMIENKILKKKKLFIFLFFFGEALFLLLVKAKNQLQNFKKQLKQKRCAIICLNVPNFCYFSKKTEVKGVKNIENCSKSLIIQLLWKYRISSSFYVFHHVNLIFGTFKQFIAHLFCFSYFSKF